MENWVLVLDSGIGGLWTLKKLQKSLPKENFLFFMDKLNAPYGNKSYKKLNRLVCQNVKKIREKYKIKAIVLACNTASSVCFNQLKNQNIDLPIIKIQPFLDKSKFEGNTLILATDNTAKFCPEIKQIVDNKTIFLQSFGTLAKQIDNSNGNFDAVLPFLRQNLCKYLHMNIKSIVLGCTHYNFIMPQLKKIFGNVKFFENSQVVAKECKKVLEQNANQKKSGDGRTIIFCKI